MFLIPIEPGNNSANGRIAGYDAIEIGGIALRLYKCFAPAIRASCEVRTRPPTVEVVGDRLCRNCGDVHSSKQVIVLLGLIKKRPATIKEAALMPSVSECNRKLSTGHGSEYSWQRPRSEAQKKSKDKLNCSSHLTIHDRPPHAGLAILLLVFACGVHNGDLLFFCFFSAHNPVRELSMGCAQV